MNYRVIIYVISLFVTAFAFSGINFKDFFRSKHNLEANNFTMLLIISVAYLVASFFISFIEIL